MKHLFIFILFILSFQLSIAQDHPDGPYKEYYDSGELKKEGHYKNKKRVGEWKQYYKNGQVSTVYSYNDGKYNKESISYFETGVVSHKTEKENGVYVNFGYYESGKLKYKRQDKSGYFKSYYESGAPEIEAKYFEYDLVGEWIKFYENGEKEWLVTYKNGYRDGLYENYYKNGDLKLEGTNVEDKVHGEEKRYLEGNILEWQGKYVNGTLNKTWIKFDIDGNKVEKIKFKDGVALKNQSNTKLLPTKVAEGVLEHVPVFPGCENFLTNKTRKKCMSIAVATFINKNFNSKIGNKFNLTGKQKIYVIFKVNKEGKIGDVNVRAPHPALEKEAVRVISMLPNVQPGKQRGKPVIVPFSIPIVYQVN